MKIYVVMGRVDEGDDWPYRYEPRFAVATEKEANDYVTNQYALRKAADSLRDAYLDWCHLEHLASLNVSPNEWKAGGRKAWREANPGPPDPGYPETDFEVAEIELRSIAEGGE